MFTDHCKSPLRSPETHSVLVEWTSNPFELINCYVSKLANSQSSLLSIFLYGIVFLTNVSYAIPVGINTSDWTIDCLWTGQSHIPQVTITGLEESMPGWINAVFAARGGPTQYSAAAARNVLSEKRGSVLAVGINRPEARNAVNQETARLLFEELSAFDSDPALSVAVLYGVGGNFCAGYDLKELGHHYASLKWEQDVTKGPAPMGPSRMQLSKPMIAAISGYAVAGGLELALLADLRVVEQSAILGVFCRRFGVPLIDGGTVRLPQLIGLSRALDLILTGRPVDAQEALAFGLANRVVPDGQALQAALELAEQISSFPPQCLRADRSSAYYSAFNASSFSQAMQFETDGGKLVIQAEAIAGAGRFSSGTGRSGTFS